MADVVTNREQINEIIQSRLGELDNIRGRYQDAYRAVGQAEQLRDQLADEYAELIEAFIETGWATKKGLSGQGHSIPKGRPGRRRAPLNSDATNTTEEGSL